MTCQYTFAGPDGRSFTITGRDALKEYLARPGVLDSLLPERAAGFKRTPVQAVIRPSVPREQVNMVDRMATGIAARFANPPKVVVFTDMQDPRIDEKVREEDARQKAGGAKGEPEGFYYRGVVYLNAAQLKAPEAAARVMLHESLGHYGLRGVFGPALNSVLEQIVALRKGDVIARAKKYGLDVNDPEQMLQAAEEVLAFMAQETPNIGFVKRAIAAIRSWLRQNVPGFAELELSDAEIIRDYILPARAFVEQGARVGRDMAQAAFSRSTAKPSDFASAQWEEATEDMVTADLGNGWTAAATQEDGVVELSILDPRGVDFGEPVQLKSFQQAMEAMPEIAARRIGENDEIVGRLMASRIEQTESAEFKRRFAGSKVVDEQGKPRMVYHTSAVAFDTFDPDRIRPTNPDAPYNGFFFAGKRGIAGNWGVTRSFYLSLKNPASREHALAVAKKIENDYDLNPKYKKARSLSDATRIELISQGYDGIVHATPEQDDLQGGNWIAFFPEQIIPATGDSPEVRFSRAVTEPTDTREFKEFFGDSMVVTEDGKPQRMYHASFRDLEGGAFDRMYSLKFRRPLSMDTVGSWFSDNPSADGGAGMYAQSERARIYPVYLRIERPKIYTTFKDFLREMHEAEGRRYEDQKVPALGSTEGLRTKLKAQGYDGIAFLKTENQSLHDEIKEYQDAVKRARKEELSVARADREPYTAKRERLEQKLKSIEAELNEFGGSTEFDKQYVWVAFEPEQIKSAIGNVGAYGRRPVTSDEAANLGMTADEANEAQAAGDIRFSRAATAPASEAPAEAATAEPETGLTLPEQGMLRRVQSAVQDNMNRVRQVQERIEKITGASLPEYADYYGAETNRPGRIAARLEDFQAKMLEPLVAKVAKSGHTTEQLSELLHAMHATERNERVREINSDMDAGSGMTDERAGEILAKYQGNRALHKLADEAREIAKATLELKLAYGLIDIETFATLSEIYEHYVPLKGDGEFGPKIKRAMGHDEREEFILENIARDYEQAVVVGEKNLARQSLLQMVLQNPDENLWTVGVPPKGRKIVKEAGFFVAYKDGTILGKFKTEEEANRQSELWAEWFGEHFTNYDVGKRANERVVEFEKQLQDNEVPVYVDGKLIRIQINGDEQLARQLRPLDRSRMNPILEAMRSVNRYLSKIYTGYNPAFIIKNTTRDAMTGTINIMGNEGAGTMARAWANYPAAMKALTVFAAKGKVPEGEAGAYLDEYRSHGGKTGASYMSDLEEQGKTLQRLFDDAYGASGYLGDKRYGKAAAVAGRKIIGGMAHVVEVMNQATENGLRLALFMAMRKQGVSAGEAAQAAKAVTVDFDRKGSQSNVLGALFLFFNPAVQGTANALKTLTRGQHKRQAWMALGALAALGFYAASSGLDEDKDKWLGESWENRAKNLVLNVGGRRLKVPLSMEFSPFYALGVALAEAKRGAASKMKAAGHIVSSFIDAYFPLQGAFSSESDNHGMDVAMAATPTIVKPALQVAANRNTFGSQVYPDNELTKDRPDNLKMFKGTKGSAYDAASQAIASVGELTGAGKYENDITKVSPETIKMLWRTYTGGLGQFVTDMAGMANVSARAPGSLEISDVPVLKDFVKAGDETRLIRSRYYELTKDARAAAEEFRQAKKAGDGEAMDKIMDRPDKSELLGLDRLIRSTNAAAAKIRDEMVDVNQDAGLSLADKRAKLKALEKEEEELYRGAIEAFR